MEFLHKLSDYLREHELFQAADLDHIQETRALRHLLFDPFPYDFSL